MTDREQYTPGPASGAQVRKGGEKWTLILVRELRHSPEKVWLALTDPAHLREWAPFEFDGHLGTVGTVKLTWVGAPAPLETRVTRADAPKVLEYNDTRWELEALGGGTRLTLWHNIDRRFISWGAAGWHIAFDVLDHLLSGTPIARIVGTDAMKSGGWQRLNARIRQAVRYGNAQLAAAGGSKVVNRRGRTLSSKGLRSTCRCARSASGSSSRGGHIELEQTGSADPPLAVHCLYGCRHRQHRRRVQGKYTSRVGLLAVFPLALLLFTGLYLFVLPYTTKWGSQRRTD